MNLNKSNGAEFTVSGILLEYNFFLPYKIYLSIGLLFILSNCEQSFTPIKQNNSVPLSMYGYLDASADTQWVRITPIRYQIDQTLEKPEMNVTVEHLSSGNKAVLNDSLFQFRQGFNVINAWTKMDIQPGATYQVEATRPDGATSRVTVKIPDSFPLPRIADIIPGCTGLLRIENVPRLVDVQSKWEMRIFFLNSVPQIVRVEEITAIISYIDGARRVADGAYEVFIDTANELNNILSGLENASYGIVVDNRKLFIASGGPEWTDDIRNLDDIEYALPEGVSNVENGLGYMFGVLSRSIPYLPSEDCVDPFNPNDY